MSVSNPEAPTAVYRLFDDSGALLYVGVAVNPATRWTQHASEKDWWPEVKRKTVDWHDDREAAFAAEVKLIKTERPRYNVVGTPEHANRVRQGHVRWRVRERLEVRQAQAAQHRTLRGLRLVSMINKAAQASGVSLELVRQRGGHQLWICGNVEFVIVPGAEISIGVAEQVFESLESELGKGWWR